ncbi:MAG: hypothetical protein ABI181_15310 [Mycobacteriaceae bacterium]
MELSVQCRTRPDRESSTRHPVTIHPDGTVSTPHDLAAERVAVAFGGYCSCLVLVERTGPALHAMLPLITRRTHPELRRDARGGWRLPPASQVAGCCRNRKYPSPAKAFWHLRSPTHLAGQYDVPLWQLDEILAADGPWHAPTAGARTTTLVRELDGVIRLWRAGIHPEEIPALAAVAAVVGEPLPVAYFLELVHGDVDRRWLAAVLAHRPDPETATWLAGLTRPQRWGDVRTWGRWLSFGLPQPDTLTAVQAQVPPELVLEGAELTGESVHVVAKHLAVWAAVGCSPTPRQLLWLQGRGVEVPRPSRGAIDAVCAEVGDPGWGRTELALLLEVLGTRHDVVRTVGGGLDRSVELDGVRETA